MRGGFIHNQVLIGAVAKRATALDMAVRTEVPITVANHTLYGDLIIQARRLRILVEAELTPRRVSNDVEKAIAFDVEELWILVPNPVVAELVRRRLQTRSFSLGTCGIFVFTLPQSLQRLEAIFEFLSQSNDRGKTIETNRKPNDADAMTHPAEEEALS